MFQDRKHRVLYFNEQHFPYKKPHAIPRNRKRKKKTFITVSKQTASSKNKSRPTNYTLTMLMLTSIM